MKRLLSLIWQVSEVLLVESQAPAPDQTHHYLVKRSCTSASEKPDDTQHDLQHVFAANIAVEQEIILAAVTIAFFYIHMLLMSTNARSIEAE